MSDSDTSDAGPHFRVPQGSSDEEIDSDLASLSSMDLPRSNGAPPDQANPLDDDHDGGDDDDDEQDDLDPDEGEGMLLSDMLSSAPAVDKHSVSQTARKLIAPLREDSESEELPDHILDAEDEESEADEQKLAEVAFAATNRRDLDKRRLREARTVAPVVGEETIHSAPGTEAISQKDMMQRMLSALGKAADGDKGLAIAQLEKKVNRVHGSGKKQLSVPLPEPVQGRIARAAAYEKVNEVVSDKWAKVVSNNRRAEQLVFPLNGPGRTIGRNSSDIAGNFQPINEYEQEIHNMLVQAGVASEKQVVNGEGKAIDDLGVSEVSREEIMERRRQLAKMRSLMFHYERKMKRIKKIKSKKYRRLMKKEREKVAEMAGSEDEEEALMKAERQRAEERMRLRHKNTSKWVRRKLSRPETKREGDTKAAIEEQLRLHQELMKKQGVAVDSDDSDSEDSPDDESETVERLQEKLKGIEAELKEDSENAKKPKGLMGMRFMQAAQERQRKEALELLNEMKESGGSDDDGEKRVVFKGKRYFNVESQEPDNVDRVEEEERQAPGLVEGDFEEDDIEGLSERIRQASEASEGSLAVKEKEQKAKNESMARRRAQLKKRICVDVNPVRVANRTANGDDAGMEVQSKPWPNAGEESQASEDEEEGIKGSRRDKDNEHVSATAKESSNVHKRRKKNKKNNDQKPSTSGEAQPSPIVAQTDTVGDLESNPWLKSGNKKDMTEDEAHNLRSGAEMEDAVGSDDKGPKKKKKKAKKKGGKQATKAQGSSGEAKGLQGSNRAESRVGTEDNPWLKAGAGNQKSSKSKKKSKRKRAKDAEEPAHNKRLRTEEEEEDAMARMREVAAAFAGAGGAEEEDFEMAKREEIEAEMPDAKELQAEVLPGWGKWDGAGVRARKSESAFARAARERLAQARRAAVGGRKDSRMKHVILDERRIKQAAMLTMAQVPFPYAKREEWEMEVRTPICKEFVTGGRFSRVVRPRIGKRVGERIDPIAETAGGKRAVLQMRKERAEKRERARKGLMR
ncbi:Utp14 protein [Gracilaria domingensis]|nr:Utp14 protein [Gracilaria domingensis]